MGFAAELSLAFRSPFAADEQLVLYHRACFEKSQAEKPPLRSQATLSSYVHRMGSAQLPRAVVRLVTWMELNGPLHGTLEGVACEEHCVTVEEDSADDTDTVHGDEEACDEKRASVPFARASFY